MALILKKQFSYKKTVIILCSASKRSARIFFLGFPFPTYFLFIGNRLRFKPTQITGDFRVALRKFDTEQKTGSYLLSMEWKISGLNFKNTCFSCTIRKKIKEQFLKKNVPHSKILTKTNSNEKAFKWGAVTFWFSVTLCSFKQSSRPFTKLFFLFDLLFPGHVHNIHKYISM